MDTSQVIKLTAIVFMAGVFGLLTVSDKYKSMIAIVVVLVNAVITTVPALLAMTQNTQTGIFLMPHLLGNIVIKVDSLSAWFILIINFTSINGALYGSGYLKAYSHLKINRELHWIFYTLFHISMVWVCMFENGLAFLISWELMSLSSLMLVIFEYQKKETLKAGLNYMVQMHLSVVLLTLGFIWLFISSGSFNFSSLAGLAQTNHSLWIFIVLFAGFAIKAGFIPFHTWLPKAHPAAPSHVSGVMSGVIVKLGIYGILRTITYLRYDWLIIGEVILSLSVITAIYGIANAAVIKDFKAMLAFCTIENIGIIGIGIGLGLIGMGNGNPVLVMIGFSAALLHTLNHSLFKSLLFFGAGSVYQQTHTRNMEQLGGLIKKMPFSAIFFLIGAMAIGGLPPFNGFVSEYLIYFGLFKGLNPVSGISQVVLIVLSIAGLAIVGGISLLTFTKSFGVIFLGQARSEFHHEPKEISSIMQLPQYMIVVVMLSVALVPQFYLNFTSQIVSSIFPLNSGINPEQFAQMTNNMETIGLVSLSFIGLLFLMFGLRWIILHKREKVEYETWGCGYVVPVEKAQYTGSSYSRSFGHLFSFLVKERKTFSRIAKPELYPENRTFSTTYNDLLEKYVIAPLTKRTVFLLNYFQFIQNGRIQSYVLYGLFFVILVFVGSALNLIK
ncbi:MAG: proton-conducting transporter membrane subunit [Mariniphaga sp.]